LISFRSISKFSEILQVIQPNLSTNVNLDQAMALAGHYVPATETVHEMTIPGSADSLYIPVYEQEVYVWVPDEAALEEMQRTLQEHLNIKRPEYAPVQAEPIHS